MANPRGLGDTGWHVPDRTTAGSPRGRDAAPGEARHRARPDDLRCRLLGQREGQARERGVQPVEPTDPERRAHVAPFHHTTVRHSVADHRGTDDRSADDRSADHRSTDDSKRRPPKHRSADTEAPTTEAPTTEAPTTEAPTTEAPTTEAPTTEAPTTEAPTTATATTDSGVSPWVWVRSGAPRALRTDRPGRAAAGPGPSARASGQREGSRRVLGRRRVARSDPIESSFRPRGMVRSYP